MLIDTTLKFKKESGEAVLPTGAISQPCMSLGVATPPIGLSP